jgi:hypothetical protein
MIPASNLRCDGCGQLATPEHTAKRLKRLEWTTRYRPVHIGTLFLGAFSPATDSEFLYAEGGTFAGEAGRLVKAARLALGGKSAEATLMEFQRGGFLLTHMLECPLEGATSDPTTLLQARLGFVAARIRRSLKPKRVALISRLLEPLIEHFGKTDLGCPIVLDVSKPFGLDDAEYDGPIAALSQALTLLTAVR